MKNKNLSLSFQYILICILLTTITFTGNIKADCTDEPLTEGRIGILIGLYNNSLIDLYRLEAQGKFLEIKRQMAAAICNNVTYDIEQLYRNFILSTVMLNVHGQLEAYDEALNKAKTYIDKLQNWAEINNEITEHCRKLYEAERDTKQEYKTLCDIIDTYNCHYPSKPINKPKGPRELHYPNTWAIYWSCFGAKYFDGDCLAKYNTPYGARDDHKAYCGGDKDPNPNVAGCGDEYYTCNSKHTKEHGAINCTASIRYRTFSMNFLEYYTYKRESCPVLFRRCTVTKGHHQYTKPARGKPYPSGVPLLTEHVHREKRRRQ